MLRKATDADLEMLTDFRHEAYGGSRTEIAGWLKNIVGPDNILLVELPGGEKTAPPVSMLCAVPVETAGGGASGSAAWPRGRSIAAGD